MGEAPRRETRRLKVLVLDEEIPYPLNAGKRIRTWNLLQRLAARHDVCLLCYGAPKDAVAASEAKGIRLRTVRPQANLEGWRFYLALLRNLFSRYPFSVTKHYSDRFQRALDLLLEEESWDLIHCEWTPYARFLRDGCRVPVVIATHNVESQIWARRATHSTNAIGRFFFRTQEWKMRSFERKVLRRAAMVTAVTPADAETFQSWGVASVSLVPNGVDLESFSFAPDAERDDEILFLASLDWFPNVDALDYFLKDVFPLVRNVLANATLRIVGRKPPDSLKQRLAGIAGVDFVGEVEEVNSFLDRAGIVVVPLRIGGGSRLKILEALAGAKAVVSTSVGAEGLGLVPGKHLLIADSPREFAKCICELSASPAARHRLGQNGRELMVERYGWNGIATRLETVWMEAGRHLPLETSAPRIDREASVTL